MTESRKKCLRVLALLAFFAAAWWVGLETGLTDRLSKKELQAMVLGAGVWGTLLFAGLFSVGLFIQIPGIVFVTGGVLIYGLWLGMLASYLAGLVAVSISFVVAKSIGGDPLAKLKSERARKMIERLHHQPVRTMSILRIFFQMSPALNVALALSGVRFRDYLFAAAIGMWIPVIVMAAGAQYFFG